MAQSNCNGNQVAGGDLGGETLHQLEMVFGGSSVAVARPTSRAENRRTAKRAVRLPVLQEALPVETDRFVPSADVPKDRRHCPEERPCTRLRCFWNLFRVEAEDRAGRPGLANVPRDENGRTLRVEGDVGEQTAGPTFNPGWLELERRARVMLDVDQDGTLRITPHDPATEEQQKGWLFRSHRVGSWTVMRRLLHPGEMVDVYNHHDKFIAQMTLTRWGTFVLDRPLPDVPQTKWATLVRVREVPSCGLDLIEKHGRMTNEQIGDALGGKHRTGIARIVNGAGRKIAGLEIDGERVDLRDMLEEW